MLFPGLMVPLASADEAIVQAVTEAAASPSKMLALFAQKTGPDGQPTEELYGVGTAANVLRMARAPTGAIQAIIQGLARVRLLAMEQEKPSLRARVEVMHETDHQGIEMEALYRSVLSQFQKAVGLTESLPDELGAAAETIAAAGSLADFVAAHLNMKPEERQAVLEAANIEDRLRLVNNFLTRELEVLQVEQDIQSKVRGEMEQGQRQFILREQLKAIQRELGESELTPEIDELQKRMEEAHMPEEARKEAERELERLRSMPQAAAEYQVSRNYLEWLVEPPVGQEHGRQPRHRSGRRRY